MQGREEEDDNDEEEDGMKKREAYEMEKGEEEKRTRIDEGEKDK